MQTRIKFTFHRWKEANDVYYETEFSTKKKRTQFKSEILIIFGIILFDLCDSKIVYTLDKRL